jgi:hypothetical protein
MFENLKAGDTIKIGEEYFNFFNCTNIQINLINKKGESFICNKDFLEFLGAEIVRKAPPKYTPVKWLDYYNIACYGLSCGKLHHDGLLGVLYSDDDIWVKDWEVLEIEK